MNKKIKFFLVVTEGGSVRSVKTKPDLKMDEISVGMTLDIPQSLFRRPHLEASLKVDEDAVQRPEISVETVDSIKQAIETGTGMKVVLRIADDE